jgi:hypothetical protein
MPNTPTLRNLEGLNEVRLLTVRRETRETRQFGPTVFDHYTFEVTRSATAPVGLELPHEVWYRPGTEPAEPTDAFAFGASYVVYTERADGRVPRLLVHRVGS